MLLQHETAFKLQQKSFSGTSPHALYINGASSSSSSSLKEISLFKKKEKEKKKALSEKMQVGVQLIELLFT